MRKYFLTAIFFIICCASVLCLDINSEQGIALANGTLSVAEESANLTSSETNNGVNLHSYINDFVSQKDIPHTAISFGGALISSGTYFQNNNTVTLSSLIYTNVSGDDNIVNFIPKRLFTYACNYLYVGEEYGFFIATVDKTTRHESTVIIFDVIISDSNEQDYMLDVKIQPIYSMIYVYVTEQTGSVPVWKVSVDQYFE